MIGKIRVGKQTWRVLIKSAAKTDRAGYYGFTTFGKRPIVAISRKLNKSKREALDTFHHEIFHIYRETFKSVRSKASLMKMARLDKAKRITLDDLNEEAGAAWYAYVMSSNSGEIKKIVAAIEKQWSNREAKKNRR